MPEDLSSGQSESSTKALSGIQVTQAITLPENVHEGENDRFVATREIDYDKGTFAVVIKDREQPGREVTVMFRLVRTGLTKVHTHVSVYSGGKVVLEGHGLSVDKILKQVRKELNTKAIRNDGPIADFLGRIYSMVIEEAEKVRRELIKQLRKKLFNELRGNQELLNNPLQYIITKVLSIVHFGDEIAKKAGVLGIVSSRLPHKKRVNVAITGPSSSGKSNLLEALSELIPKSWIQGGRVFAYSSPKAIFYEGERQVRGNVVEHRINVAHKVIVYIEPTPFYTKSEETVIGRELLKLLLSDAKEGRPLCHKAVDADSKVTRYYCIEGKPVVVTTLPDEYVDWLKEQELARLLPVSVDLNPETERAVFEFMLNEDEEQEKQFKQAALLVRFFLSLLPVVKSVKLSDDAKEAVRDTLGRYIGDAKTKRHIRRALRDLIGLAAAYELLNYTASIIQEGKEVPKVLDKLFVTGKSIKYVWDLVGDAIVGKAFGKPFEAQEKRILRIIENAGGVMKRKEIIEAMKPLSESTIKRLLNRLVDFEVLVRCPGKRGLYALPGKCPESDQITNYTQEEQGESKDQGEGERP
jgi:energy-coupling factor transporter ATP-binding protein EcfA2